MREKKKTKKVSKERSKISKKSGWWEEEMEQGTREQRRQFWREQGIPTAEKERRKEGRKDCASIESRKRRTSFESISSGSAIWMPFRSLGVCVIFATPASPSGSRNKGKKQNKTKKQKKRHRKIDFFFFAAKKKNRRSWSLRRRVYHLIKRVATGHWII